MSKQFFPKINRIAFEGPDSKNPLAFKHYDAAELVEGKPMKDHLRFAAVYWHTMRGTGGDMFGWETADRPWNAGECTAKEAISRARAFFEFATKLGVPYYCWHDRDLASHGRNLKEANAQFDTVGRELKKLQADTGLRLLWGTAQNFVHPRYMHGAATSPNADAFCFAAAQVKKAMEWTHELKGEGYVFWGGREGYSTLLNTDMKRELDHLGRFMHMAVDYKKKIALTSPFCIEPKPKEPTKHQYDSDAASCLNFLREYGLLEHFKLNLEVNHAWLAGKTMEHELEVAGAAGALGSIDANMGDYFLGWDTDQFPTDLYLTAKTMLSILKYGGLTTGGVNFDAKVRRESFQLDDLFIAHIAGMDAFARGLKIAAAIRKDGRIGTFVQNRYRTWDTGIGAKIESGKASFADCEKHALALGNVTGLESGRQELLEAILNDFI
ncbi:MAG: xylose isomerase [Pedosphaera sp.]|nr:xylose isomerase [Pedosphaera sp.]